MDTRTTIPLVNTPFLDSTGHVSQPWWRFLLTLLIRTGGDEGSDLTLVLKDIADLQLQANTETFSAAVAHLFGSYGGIQQDIMGNAFDGQSLASINARLSALEMDHGIAPPLCAPTEDDIGLFPVHGIYNDPNLHAVATTTSAGFMSAADKIKLNAL